VSEKNEKKVSRFSTVAFRSRVQLPNLGLSKNQIAGLKKRFGISADFFVK